MANASDKIMHPYGRVFGMAKTFISSRRRGMARARHGLRPHTHVSAIGCAQAPEWPRNSSGSGARWGSGIAWRSGIGRVSGIVYCLGVHIVQAVDLVETPDVDRIRPRRPYASVTGCRSGIGYSLDIVYCPEIQMIQAGI